jgi:hypothetical protein
MRFSEERRITTARKLIICGYYLPFSINKKLHCIKIGRIDVNQKSFSNKLRI